MTYGVTGSLTPDATCNYFDTGIHDSRQYWRRIDGAYYLWWSALQTEWYITIELGVLGTDHWKGGTNGPAGVYTPQGTYQGDATVTLGEHP